MLISVCMGSIRDETLPHALRAIRKQSMTDWELVVVLQGTEGSPEVRAVASLDHRIRLVSDSGRGLSRARNLAMEHATGEIFAFTDDDCEPAADWLAVIASRFSDTPELGILAGSVTVAPKSRRGLSTCPQLAARESIYDPKRDSTAPADFGWIGANFAVSRSAASLIGPFDERLGAGARFYGGEELDYKLRAETAGVVMATTPDSVVSHTFGRRYGAITVWRLLSRYAYSTGAVAAKLTLGGDPRGPAWKSHLASEFRAGCCRPWSGAPLRTGMRAAYFYAGYRAAMNELDGGAGDRERSEPLMGIPPS